MYKYHGSNIYRDFRHTGIAIGSFLNVVIDRLPADKSIVYPHRAAMPVSTVFCGPTLSGLQLFVSTRPLPLLQSENSAACLLVELGTGLLTADCSGGSAGNRFYR